jgi:hypothetical protein
MGYYVAFKAMQYEIKSDITSLINKGIDVDITTVISVNKKEINNINFNDNGKEINYNGQMYDVIKSEENNTTVTYYCLNDTEETTLYASLDEQINAHVINTVPVKNHSQKDLSNDVVKVFYQNYFSYTLYNCVTAFSFQTINTVYTSAVIAPNSPPPEFV